MRLSNLSKVTNLKLLGFPRASIVKNPPGNAGDAGSIPGSGRSPGGGNSNPFQYPCLENPMNRGIWQTVVHSVTKSRIRLKRLSMMLDLLSSPRKRVISNSVIKLCSVDPEVPWSSPAASYHTGRVGWAHQLQPPSLLKPEQCRFSSLSHTGSM